MVKRKVKEESATKKKAKAGPGIPEPELLKDESRAKIRAEWASVISELKGREFASISEAEDEIISAVITRLSIPAEKRERLRGFLKLVFSTDPSLQEEIVRGVKVKPQ